MTRTGLLLLGLAVGLAGTALHQSVLWLAVTAAGFSPPPLAMSLPRGEGDVVLAGTGSLLLACLAALVLGIGLAGLLPAGRPAPQPQHDAPPPSS